MKHTRILFLILILSSNLWSKNYYYFQDITQDLNLSSAAITTICEDKNGFIWFGNINGVYYHNTIGVEKIDFCKTKNSNPENTRVYTICRDSKENIWVGAQSGIYKYIGSKNALEPKTLYNPETNETLNKRVTSIIEIGLNKYLIHVGISAYIYMENDSILQSIKPKLKGNITYLNKDKDGSIYFGMSDGKVYYSNDSLKTIRLLYNSTKGRVSAVCKDGNKYYIGFNDEGIDIINPNGAKIGEMSSQLKGDNYLKYDQIRQIIKRKNNEIWIATRFGIIVLDQGKQTLLDSRKEVGLPHSTIFTLHEGRNDNIWVGTYSGGLAYYSDYNYIFKYNPIDYGKKQVVRSGVSSFCEDARGYIWIGSEDEGGIKVYDPQTDTYINELSPELDQKTKGVKTIDAVEHNLIAIGKAFSNKILLYNYEKHKVEADIELPLKEEPGILRIKYFNGKLWVTDRSKLISYDLKTKEIKEIIKYPGRVWQLYFDSSHNLWISSTMGLYIKKPGAEKAERIVFSDASTHLNEIGIYSIYEDKNGILWLGTMGEGLYLYSIEKGTITPAPDHQLTQDADIYSVIKDAKNNTWYNTNLGLYRYDVSNKQTDYYGSNDGFSNIRTIPNSAYCSQEGKLYFGTTNGFNIIDPKNIKTNPYAPSVYLASMKVNNEPFKNKDTDTIKLNQLKSITLKSNQNTLIFNVRTNNYIKPEKTKYRYRLKNYEDSWVETSQNKDIVFTKVPSGTYLFEAYGTNNDNVWSKKPYQLQIIIRAPLYRRWYAILLYIGIICTIINIIYKEIKTKINLKKEITEERHKLQTSELINNEKIKLFTNISHELRTPLSLIMSPIKTLLKNNTFDEQTKHLLQVADRNTTRLLKIANQTLDFRLIEKEKLEPFFEKHDIVQLTKEVYLYFQHEISDRQINFTFFCEFQRLEASIDRDKVEKIIYNLLSNAIKFTPENESISISISKKSLTLDDYKDNTCAGEKFTGKAIVITIKDTGPGIKPQFLPHIFERFTKGNDAHEMSSGIGLHMCKEYSKMNNGNMLLSTEEGKGASFSLNLPLTDDTKYELKAQKQQIKLSTTNQKESQNIVAIENSKQYTVMIVEDNSELRRFLRDSLQEYFKIITANRGEKALEVLKDVIPDVIITDVSMPGITGINLLKTIKEDEKIQHIPIIVMTAHVERNYQMESVLCGAEAFFTKPIDEALLLAQINNSIAKKNKETTIPTPEPTTIEEHSFVANAEKIIKENLQNPQFKIKDLLKELNVSKTTLGRKLKAETQLNTSAFVRDVRLRNAVQLICSRKFSIHEIAAYVGYNSTSYFIRTFKTKYGVTPKEYQEQSKEKSSKD